MNILSTERLYIRRITLKDAPSLFNLMTDKDWILNISDRGIKTIADAENYITTRLLHAYEENEFGFYALILKSNRSFIGIAGLIHRDGLVNADNQSSINLLKKLGLDFEKKIRLTDKNKDIMLFS